MLVRGRWKEDAEKEEPILLVVVVLDVLLEPWFLFETNRGVDGNEFDAKAEDFFEVRIVNLVFHLLIQIRHEFRGGWIFKPVGFGESLRNGAVLVG